MRQEVCGVGAAAARQGGSEQRMQIGEVAERTGLSINTLRHYDQIGLVTPSVRSQGGFRLYTDSDLARLLVIRRMKPLGFSLEQMRELLHVTDALATDASPAGAGELHEVLDHYLAVAREKRTQLVQELAYAEEFITTMDALGRPAGRRRPRRRAPAGTTRRGSR